MNHARLFSVTSAYKQWIKFKAAGYQNEVTGVIYHANQAVCGMPLGGLATGHIDLDTDGTLGRCTIFNSIIPPRQLDGLAFLALAVKNRTWALTTKKINGTTSAKEISYWGHYPIADLHYDLDAPVDIGLRAWAPFIPANAEISNTPAMVFEVRLCNNTRDVQSGVLALTIPGPTQQEAQTQAFSRSQLKGKLNGVSVVTGQNKGYVLAVVGTDKVRFGGGLTDNDSAFAEISNKLPAPNEKDSSSSIALDFSLAANESKVVRFVFCWYYPIIASNAIHGYEHAYAGRFSDAVAVAEMMADKHEILLRQIIGWQQVIYSQENMPEWLRDCLVNIFHLLAEDAFWEKNSIPPEDWAKDTGIFSMVESTRTCPGQSCIPSDWYGNFPVVYFFPELARSTLRGFAHFQLPNGEIPIYWGVNYDRQNPLYQLLHVTNSCNYVDLVDRLWQRTADDSILYEFYPSAKRAINYLQSLDSDGDGIIDCHPGMPGIAHQFYNAWMWYGAAVHIAGMWLSVLRMAQRMAEKVRDISFANDCRIWLKSAAASLEEKLWKGSYYLLYNDVNNNISSDTILTNQLAGQWCAYLHGTEAVFPADRQNKVFEVIKKMCVPAAKWGAAGAIKPDGTLDTNGKHTSKDIFMTENLITAMTMLYAGHKDIAMEIAYKNMENIVIDKGLTWDMPNSVSTDTGEVTHGHDFDQMMILWALPAAIEGKTLAQSAAPGGFIDKIIQEAKKVY